jgi:hypothetical protein
MSRQPSTAKAGFEPSGNVTQSPENADLNDVPNGYWRSYRFIGSITAIILLANGLFIGYVMPVRTAKPTNLKKDT